MKIVLAFLVINNIIYSQNFTKGRVTYTTSISFDTINIANKYKKNKDYEVIKKTTLHILKESNSQSYLLSFNKDKSFFTKEYYMENDGENKINLIEILVGKGSFYTDLKTNMILCQIDFMGDVFLVQYKPIKWQVTQKTKRIGNYICYKATTLKIVENKEGKITRVITAWYTPQIPTNFGPKQYYGLPGLILELQIGSLNFLATKIEISPKDLITIKKPAKGKVVTKAEFEKIGVETMSSYKKGF